MTEKFQIQPLGFLVGANGAPEESKGKWGMIGALSPNMVQMLQVMSTAQLEARIAELETHDKAHTSAIGTITGQMSNGATITATIAAAIQQAQCREALALLQEQFTDESPCTVLWAVEMLKGDNKLESQVKTLTQHISNSNSALRNAIGGLDLKNPDQDQVKVLKDQLVVMSSSDPTSNVKGAVQILFSMLLNNDLGEDHKKEQAVETLKAILPGGTVHRAAKIVTTTLSPKIEGDDTQRLAQIVEFLQKLPLLAQN